MTILSIASAHGQARLSLQGAQVLDASFADQPFLWLSPLADFSPGKAIRGGVPLCFPWFGKHPAGLPAHGFARNQLWTLDEQAPDALRLSLCDNAQTRALWPHAFRLSLQVRIDHALHLDLQVDNTGPEDFEFSYALHSYFAVQQLAQARVDGLEGRLRRELGHVTTPQHGELGLARPIDAIFELADGELALQDGARRIRLLAEGMRSAVVWNPGPAAETVADIGAHWPAFACVERGNIGAAAIHLAAGASHRASLQLLA